MTKAKTSYSCVPLKKSSDNEMRIRITYCSSEFICTIRGFQYGIFRIVFDVEDEGIRYKNKANIGTGLIPAKFDLVNVTDDTIVLELKDTLTSNLKPRVYRIVVHLHCFFFEYFIDDVLLMKFNTSKSLALINEVGLKSNSFDFAFMNITHCFGIPERSSHFILKDDHYRLFNVDDPDQHIGNPLPTYGAIPMLHGVNKDYTITVFNNNASDTWIELKTKGNRKEVSWITEGGTIDLYIHSDNDYNFNNRKVSLVTGFAPMAPLFAFGYHQCRWGYSSDKEVDEIVDKFDELNIPLDVFWFDIDHTKEKRYFVWDKENFGNAKTFIQKLKDKNRILVTIIDPHIKADESYKIYQVLSKNDLLVKRKAKDSALEPYKGYCWPGLSYWPDFFNYDKVIPLYKQFFKDEDYFFGFDNIHTWIDMNEPSVFNIFEMTMPKENIHYDGTQLVEHREVHNLYGHSYQRIAYESLMNRYDNKIRPFILSRSYYAGSQQYGWIWTGDNKATMAFMNCSIETNMTNALCGYSGCGSDVGGFIDDPTPELLRRWYSLGSLYVYFRGHSCFNSIRREPWLFDNETLNSIRESIRFKYKVLLFYYTKFYEHTLTGIPILQPIWMRFKEHFDDLIALDPSSLFVIGHQLIGVNMFTIQDQGIKFLNEKAPVLYEISTGQKMNGLIMKNENEMIAKLMIGGSIIPWNEDIKISSHYVIRSPLSLKIFLDKDKKAAGTLFFDKGIELDTHGYYIYLNFQFEEDTLTITNTNNRDYSQWDSKDIIPIWNTIEIYGNSNNIKCYSINNKEYQHTSDNQITNGIRISLRDLNMKIDKPLSLKIS